MKKTVLLLLGIFLISQASAIDANSYDATVILDKVAYEEINLLVSYSGESEIELNFPPDINDLVIELNGVKTECTQKTVLGATNVVCPIDFKADYHLSAKFNTNYVLIDLDEKYLFKQEVTGPFNINSLSLRVKLPEGSTIAEPIGNHVTPAPTNIYSDGRRIILLFETQNIEDDFEVSVIYESNAKQNTFALLVGTIVVLLFIISLRWKRKSPTEILLDDELVIINIIKESKKPIRQRDIEKQVEFSKAKLSRVLRSLEERGLLKRTPLGNTNIIELIKK